MRSRWDFCLGGACYPETHPTAPSPETDLANLVRKVEAGVDFLITQLFFDNEDFFDFTTRAREAGIRVPIMPGIMPIVSASNIRRITSLCGAGIPPELERRLSEVEHDDALTLQVGIEWATKQCVELLERGAPGIHFYTLNRSPATRSIFQRLTRAMSGLRIGVLLSGEGTSFENLAAPHRRRSGAGGDRRRDLVEGARPAASSAPVAATSQPWPSRERRTRTSRNSTTPCTPPSSSTA